ncbi:MAG: GNAT family N-acetyltransferase [Armatimonas sp.]
MKIIGSRASGTADPYSDWDHVLETEADFAELRQAIETSICSMHHGRGDFHLVTLLDAELQMHDYSDSSQQFEAQWQEIAALADNSSVSDYWIIMVKHLKGLFRDYLLLVDFGIEHSLKRLRDAFVLHHYGVERYHDFFAFRQLGANVNITLAPLYAVTGLPTRTKLERIDKLQALNTLFITITPERSTAINTLFDKKLSALRDAELVQAAARNHVSWFSEGTTRQTEAVLTAPNAVTLAFPKEEAEIDTALELARQGNVNQIGCWSVLPTPIPDLAVKLVARGFQWGWQPHWMVMDLSEELPDAPLPNSVTIVEKTDSAPWDVKDLPYHDPASPVIPNARTFHFGAWQHGQVVGQSVVHISEEGIGGIYNVSVLPNSRRQGIGRAISLAACKKAKELGCRYVLLNAATHIYNQLGFRSLGYGQTWWMHAPALAQTPLPPEQVTFVEALGHGDIATLNTLPLPDLDAPLTCNMTPLELAAALRQPEAAQWLLDKGAIPDIVALYDMGWAHRIPALLTERPELVNRRHLFMGKTPLHQAVERDDITLAQLVLAAKPDLTLKDTQFQGTPLGWARHIGRPRLAELIEQAGG